MTFRCILTTCCVVLLLHASTRAAAAESPIDRDHDFARIRTTDERIRVLLDEGTRASPTLRTLVSGLEQSDLVVYIEYDPCLPLQVAGRLTFVSAAAGVRYVFVHLADRHSRVQRLGLLGHELQHALEVASMPEVLDAESMLREYARLGSLKRTSARGVALETVAAIDVERRVGDEVARYIRQQCRPLRAFGQDCLTMAASPSDGSGSVSLTGQSD